MNNKSPSKLRILWIKTGVYSGPEYQFFDPLSERKVRFPNKLHCDNFLVHFGGADILEIIQDYPAVTIAVDGQIKTVVFDATIRYVGDIYVFQEVRPQALLDSPFNYPALVRQISSQRVFSHATCMRYELRTETQIYAHPLFVEGKRRMQQILTLHMGDDLQEEVEYIQSLAEEHARTKNLVAPGALTPFRMQRMEAALYRQYVKGHVYLNLREASYGTTKSFASSIPGKVGSSM